MGWPLDVARWGACSAGLYLMILSGSRWPAFWIAMAVLISSAFSFSVGAARAKGHNGRVRLIPLKQELLPWLRTSPFSVGG